MSEKTVLDNDFSSCITVDDYQIQFQIAAMKAEHEAFHALMALLPKEVKDEAIALWVKGTESASSEAYHRKGLRERLSESDYRKSQDLVHEAWKKMMKVSA